MMEGSLLKVCVWMIVIFAPAVCIRGTGYMFGESYQEPGHGSNNQYYKLGEFNDRCRSSRDCRQFGYVCRDNKTCQCDFMYVPDDNQKTCVGGVNQRCIYDEHCIEGAYCMHQELCKCKESTPVELEDGLICTDGAVSGSTINILIIVLAMAIVL